MWIYLEKQRTSRGKEHEHYNIFFSRDQHDGPLLPPAAALAPTLWPHFFLRWACPSEISTDGHLPSSWVQGGELENQCRVLAQSFSGLKKAKYTAEIKVKELIAKVKALNEQLLIEKQATTSAVATATRARKENATIKRAMQAIGCKVHFSYPNDTIFASSSSDEDESQEQIVAVDLEDVKDGQHRERSKELSISLSAASDADMSANLYRKTCGDITCSLRNGEGCKWPHGGCANMGSAFVGLRANFDALERLSILDCYFNPEHEASRDLCTSHSDQQPGIT